MEDDGPGRSLSDQVDDPVSIPSWPRADLVGDSNLSRMAPEVEPDDTTIEKWQIPMTGFGDWIAGGRGGECCA